MRSGTHTRDDASFGRSAGFQTMKGAGLILVAVLIGVVMLRTAPKGVTTISSSTAPHTTVTKAPADTGATAAPTTSTIPPPHPPSQVRLLVANGTQVNGLGGKIRGQLNAQGYNTDKPAIDAPTKDHTSTIIYFQPGFESDALQLATQVLSLQPVNVQPMPNPPPVAPSSLTNVDIFVIAGNDIAPSSSGGPSATVSPGATTAPAVTSSPTTAVHHTTPTTAAHTTTTTASHTTTTIKH